MLGRLFNSAASTLNPAAYTSRNAPPLESVTEEEHTRTLLFPDLSILQQRTSGHAYPFHSNVTSPSAAAAGAFDDRGGLELEVPKDFRVVIAQDALGDRDEPCILLDTQAAEAPVQGLGLDRKSPETQQGPVGHSRTRSMAKSATWDRNPTTQANASGLNSASLSRSPLQVTSPMGVGAFGRARLRSSTLSSSSPNDPDSPNSRLPSDSHGLLNCIFGSSAFTYRGPSTKMHILSLDEENRTSSTTTSPVLEHDFNSVRDPRKRAPTLSRAYTMGAQPNVTSPSQEPPTVKVLLTRMFSVALPETGDVPTPAEEVGNNPRNIPGSPGFPFPEVGKRQQKFKEKRTPMYAVAIIVQLPLASKAASRPPSRLGSRAPSVSIRPQGSVSSSLDSEGRSTWSFVDQNPTLLPTSANLDDRVDILVDHWDVITRTLSYLEKEASKEILLRLLSSSMQVSRPVRTPGIHRASGTIVQLLPNALSDHVRLKADATRAMQRISLALRIPRVITGQGRWGVWREEARWISRCLGDKEHSFFFLVLLTAFLGNHTEWLSLLGPDWYRRRHHLQQKAQQDSEPVISHRTVIVSADKMVARRLVFLLSAFLPGKPKLEGLNSPLRPGTSTSASFRPSSNSPPNAMPLRQESLRRIMNKRARANRINAYEPSKHERSNSISSTDGVAPDKPEPSDGLDPHQRRDSDVRSIRTTSLPIPFNDMSTRKSSAATTSTVTPSRTTPVPYFASRTRQTPTADDVPRGLASDSNESLASTNLLQTLKRSEGTNTSMDSADSHTASKWGSLVSGFWSPRQESSTDGSDMYFTSTTSSRKSMYAQAREREREPQRMPSRLETMAKEVGTVTRTEGDSERPSQNITIPAPPQNRPSNLDQSPTENAIEEPLRSPLKLFVDEADGVIDVDLPLPGFLSLSSSGADTMLTSPKKPRTSMSSMDGSHLSTPHLASKDGDNPPVQVAGWLKRFHEDFPVQATRPYQTLEADIKRAMAAEPTPSNAGATPNTANETGPTDRWVDVCTTLIADARTSTIKRLRLQRKIRIGIDAQQGAETPGATPLLAPGIYPHRGNFLGKGNLTRKSSNVNMADAAAANSTDNPFVEERFVEEAVMDLDSVLTDAVERVLAHSGQSSKVHSRATSPSRGRAARHRDSIDMRNSVMLGGNSNLEDSTPSLEIPRQECKRMVLGALEEVVRSVQTERSQEDGSREIGGSNSTSTATTAAGVSEDKGRWWRGKREEDTAPDNTLREAVKKWLADVEEAF